jgi:arylformamidase
MTLIDISMPVRHGMAVYDGDPEVTLERVASIANGDAYNLSRLACGVHTGTHIDAPVHFIDGAAGIEGIDLDALVGSAVVVDATSLDHDIDRASLLDLDVQGDAARVLFKTKNSQRPPDTFTRDFISVAIDAADELVRRGVRLVGIDYLSIAAASDPAPVHRAFLAAGVVVLEGLDLRQVEPGPYELICLPLLLPGSDGAPARAVLRRPER